MHCVQGEGREIVLKLHLCDSVCLRRSQCSLPWPARLKIGPPGHLFDSVCLRRSQYCTAMACFKLDHLATFSIQSVCGGLNIAVPWHAPNRTTWPSLQISCQRHRRGYYGPTELPTKEMNPSLPTATAITGVHVELEESALVTGGDSFPAYLVIKLICGRGEGLRFGDTFLSSSTLHNIKR
jgi:hypothetical protein